MSEHAKEEQRKPKQVATKIPARSDAARQHRVAVLQEGFATPDRSLGRSDYIGRAIRPAGT